MCGLAGIASNSLSEVEIAAFQDLMAVSCLRGWDGAGIARITRQGDVNWTKTVRTAASLVCSDEFAALVDKPGTVLMGHARFPTKGSISLEHTHPFRERHIVGMHNGTMTRVGAVNDFKKESDSQLLIREIATSGPQEAIKNSFGAYALSWYDQQSKRVYFLRNYERPLWLGELKWRYKNGKEFTGLIWASEEPFIKLVCDRRAFTLGKLIVLPTHKLVSFSVNMGKQGSVELHEEDCSPFESWGEWWKNKETNPPKSNVEPLHLPKPSTSPAGTSLTTTNTSDASSGKKNVTRRVEKYADGENYFLTKTLWVSGDRLSDILGKGCTWCSASTTHGKFFADKLHWLDNESFLCEVCAELDECKEYVAMARLMN